MVIISKKTCKIKEDVEPSIELGTRDLDKYLKTDDPNSCEYKQHSIKMIQLDMSEVNIDDDNANKSNLIDNNAWLDGNSIYDCNNISVDDHDGVTTIANDDPQFDNELTELDTKRVIRLRMLLILTLVISATVMSLLVHRYIAINEKKQFHTKFNNDAKKVLAAVSSSLERSLGVLNAVSISFVSSAAYTTKVDDSANTWPFVTLPDFALQASKLLPLTDGVYISIQPIVYPAQKLQWEEYASQNDQWVNETFVIQEAWDGYHGNTPDNFTTYRQIYGTFGDVEANVRYVFPQ